LAAAVPFMGALLGAGATLLLAHRGLSLLPG
jgi:hypothetical protein